MWAWKNDCVRPVCQHCILSVYHYTHSKDQVDGALLQASQSSGRILHFMQTPVPVDVDAPVSWFLNEHLLGKRQ